MHNKTKPNLRQSRRATISLQKSLHTFDPNLFGSFASLLESAKSDARDFLLVACSDQGTAPDNVSFARPDQCVIVQNMGATIPAARDRDDVTTLASLEYAICLLEVKHAIVCAHIGCKIVPNWFQRAADSALCNAHSTFVEQTCTTVDKSYDYSTVAERNDLLLREHLLFQLDNLQSHDCVATRLREGRLQLHGWLIDDSTARIQSYDPQTGQFSLLQ